MRFSSAYTFYKEKIYMSNVIHHSFKLQNISVFVHR